MEKSIHFSTLFDFILLIAMVFTSFKDNPVVQRIFQGVRPVAVALILIANNNRKFKTEYDERQLRVRGDAYRFAFYTVVIWETVLYSLSFS